MFAAYLLRQVGYIIDTAHHRLASGFGYMVSAAHCVLTVYLLLDCIPAPLSCDVLALAVL